MGDGVGNNAFIVYTNARCCVPKTTLSKEIFLSSYLIHRTPTNLLGVQCLILRLLAQGQDTVGLDLVLHLPHYSLLWKCCACARQENAIFTLCISKCDSCSCENGNAWVTAIVLSKHASHICSLMHAAKWRLWHVSLWVSVISSAWNIHENFPASSSFSLQKLYAFIYHHSGFADLCITHALVTTLWQCRSMYHTSNCTVQ